MSKIKILNEKCKVLGCENHVVKGLRDIPESRRHESGEKHNYSTCLKACIFSYWILTSVAIFLSFILITYDLCFMPLFLCAFSCCIFVSWWYLFSLFVVTPMVHVCLV